MASSIQAGFKWIGIARDVYEQYLKKEFTDPSCKMDWKLEYEDPHTSIKTTIQRPNHGLAHTLRCAAYVPLVVSAYNKIKNATISPNDIEDIQLTLLFYVVGRENDAGSKEDPYLKFRQKSAEIFGKYIREKLPSKFSEEKIRFYQQILTDTCNPKDPLYVLYTITRISHNLDLLRCVSREIYEEKMLKTISQDLGDSTQKLDQIVIECLRKTGDRIGVKQDYDHPLFIRCSTNVYFCLSQIDKVIRAIQPISRPNVENLIHLLCNLIDHEEVKRHSALSAVLDSKIEILLALPETELLNDKDQRFYRLAKRLISTENKMSGVVLELLLKDTPMAESFSHLSFLSQEKIKPALAAPIAKTPAVLTSPQVVENKTSSEEKKTPLSISPFYSIMTDKKIALDKLKTIPVPEFIAALEKEPQNATLYCNLGRVLVIGGAIVLNHILMPQQQLFLKAIDLDPHLPKAYYNLGTTLPLNGNIRLLNGTSMTQQQLFLKAIDLDLNSSLAYTILGVTLPVNGSIYLLNGTYMTQQQLYLKTIDLDPNSAWANYNLGTTLPLNGNIRLLNGTSMTQQQLYLKTIDLDPNFSWAYAALARTLPAGESVQLSNGINMTKEQLLLKSMGPNPTLPYAILE